MVTELSLLQVKTKEKSVTLKKLTVKQAKKQAQKEILKVFGIELDKDTDAEDMDVFGKTDADAALLALSVMLQGDRTESDMMALLSEISNALAENGEWNDSAAKAQIALWAAVADGTGRLDSVFNHVKGWGLGGGNVPPFEKYIRNFYSEETGLGQCGSKKISLGTIKTLESGSDALGFVCEDVKSGRWRKLSSLDKDTLGWGLDFEEGDVRNGQVNKNLTYVFENGAWRHGTSLDSTLGLSCIPARKDTLLKASVINYYKCVGDTEVSLEGLNWNSVWRKATNDELDMDYWVRNKNENGQLLKSPFTGRTMVWDADSLREPILVEQEWNKACVSYMYADKEDGYAVDTLSNGLAYTCSDTGWSKTGTFRDSRYPSTIYNGVKIKSQTWMAENLRYNSTYGSFCYENADSNCTKYGRLYTWASAMDSKGEFSQSGVGCDYGKTCSPDYRVQGMCPKGWHLPRKDEWETLFNEVGGRNVAGRMLKSLTGWRYYKEGRSGLDAYSFSALPAGVGNGKTFYSEGDRTIFWSSTQDDIYSAYIVELAHTENDAELRGLDKDNWFSVRCVKD